MSTEREQNSQLNSNWSVASHSLYLGFAICCSSSVMTCGGPGCVPSMNPSTWLPLIIERVIAFKRRKLFPSNLTGATRFKVLLMLWANFKPGEEVRAVLDDCEGEAIGSRSCELIAPITSEQRHNLDMKCSDDFPELWNSIYILLFIEEKNKLICMLYTCQHILKYSNRKYRWVMWGVHLLVFAIWFKAF